MHKGGLIDEVLERLNTAGLIPLVESLKSREDEEETDDEQLRADK